MSQAFVTYIHCPNDLDLGYIMQRLAELAQEHCLKNGLDVRRKAKVMSKVFVDTLKLGTWPAILHGQFNDNFKAKVDLYLVKVNKDYRKAAAGMVKQIYDTIDRFCSK